MKEYKITKESLLELTKKIYQESCNGYLDLAEATCESMIEEFLKDKEIYSQKVTAVTSPYTIGFDSGASISNFITGSYGGGSWQVQNNSLRNDNPLR